MIKINKLQILLILVMTALLTISSMASGGRENSYGLAVKALSAKLQNDLATEKVNLKLNKVIRYNVSRTEVGLKGTGEANNLAINFDVKVNYVKSLPVEVNYNFVPAESDASVAAEAASEDAITRDLLARLSRDYKTSNVVIAIDNLNVVSEVNGEKKYQGSGEIRIGFDWQKIDFNLNMNQTTLKANDITYDIK